MAARIETHHNIDETNSEGDESYSSLSTVCSPHDKVIIWIASNRLTSFSYTLALSTLDCSYRLKYYGPVVTLKEKYTDLFQQGRGLILNTDQIRGLTDRGSKHVVLDFLIHSPVQTFE